MSFQTSAAAWEPPTSAEHRSGIVFAVILLLVLLAVAFPEMAPQVLQGILWSGAGLLLMLRPPEVRVPRVWLWLAAGFVGFSSVGFLPRQWFHVSAWRLDLEALGLDTGPYQFVQPGLALETLAGFAVSAVVVVYLLGHRVASRTHYRVAFGLVLGVGVWTVAALYWHRPPDPFGFFPNRNHTATLLAMGTFAGLGCFAQAIRLKHPWKIVLSLVHTCLFLWVLLMVSESRAGVVLVAAGFVVWLLLTGLRHLRGHTGKAILLLLIALAGMFLIVPSKVKMRLDAKSKDPETPHSTAVKTKISFDEGSTVQPDPNMDGRIAIYHDTWSMIRHEPWCGVGPGQFAQVFPQYRKITNASNDQQCLHPESDWLWMLAETGWPATLCLAAAAAAVLLTALKQVRFGRTRFLRMGSLVAAMLLCLHGVFDVPGHHVGLLWAAALLTAMSLRTPEEKYSATAPPLSRVSRLMWRGLGALLVLAGGGLLVSQWTGSLVLPSVQAHQHIKITKELCDADRAACQRAKAEGQEYQPPAGQDPLEAALKHVNQALRISPLDPYPHYIRGMIALPLDDKREIATHAFAIQRRLDPICISSVLTQAQAWMSVDNQGVLALWTEALRRAAAEESRFPESPVGTASTYLQALQDAGNNENLVTAALELAAGKPALLAVWTRVAPASLLDREMPRLLAQPGNAGVRTGLFQVWKGRGSQGAAASFAQDHPELELAPPQ